MRRYEGDSGQRDGVATGEAARIKDSTLGAMLVCDAHPPPRPSSADRPTSSFGRRPHARIAKMMVHEIIRGDNRQNRNRVD